MTIELDPLGPGEVPTPRTATVTFKLMNEGFDPRADDAVPRPRA